MRCRHCSTELTVPLMDLGSSPPSNAYLDKAALHNPEPWFPLRVLVCTQCWLAQTEDYVGREVLFADNYAYFSSYSASWLDHAERYAEAITARYGLGPSSMVVEVAANDGYLLQYVARRNIPCYGIEPTASTAAAARAKGIEIVQEFFGERLAERLAADGRQADLIVANNVLAHVPDINDFVAGFVRLLKPNGVATFEFPHLRRLVDENQFDTIYHEHYSYLSLTALGHLFPAQGLRIIDVEILPTHGGSLRVHACRADCKIHTVQEAVAVLLRAEEEAGLRRPDYYLRLQQQAVAAKHRLLDFLLAARRKNKLVAGYGAAAKGNTLLNFAGVKGDLLPWVVDRNPSKQGKYLPGSRIPIVSEMTVGDLKPDYVLIFPWNLEHEIVDQLAYIRDWGGQFVTAIPNLRVR